MTGFIYSIAMKITGQGSVQSAVSAVEGLDNAVDGVAAKSGKAGTAMGAAGVKGRSAFSSVRNSVGSLIAKLGVMAFMLTSLNTSAQFDSLETAIKFAGGKEGVENLAFVKKTVTDLKLPLRESLEGFKLLSGGVIGTSITAEQTRKIFEATGTAARVMGLSAEDTNGAFRALSQVASKGKVQAEELRGQLGERIPGAFGIAARAMGVSTAQLDKMLERGEVYSDVFLPKFAAEMERTFAKGLPDALNTGAANIVTFWSSFDKLRVMIGEQILPLAISLINNYFVPEVDWIGRNSVVLQHLGVTFAIVYGAIKVYSITAAIAAVVTGGLSSAMALLSALLLANPIGLVVAGIAALTAGIIYAWKNFEGFRGFLTGFGSVIMEVGRLIFDFLFLPLRSVSKLLVGAFTLDKDLVLSGLKDAGKWISGTVFSIGTRVANSFNTGYKQGVFGFKVDEGILKDNDYSFKSPFDKPKSFSLARPGLPKEETTTSKATDAVSNAFSKSNVGKSKDKEAKDGRVTQGISAITKGGTKNITINLGKLMDQIIVQTENVQAGADEIAEIVQRKLLQVLNSANQVQ